MIRRPLTVVRSVAVRAATLVAALAWAAAASAQIMRGTVFQPDSATRAPGVIVVAADERGSLAARTLSGDDGAFDMRVPGAGRYVLRLLRVGFRPTVLPAVTVPDDGVSGLRAVLGAEAVVLSAVTVRSENICGSTEDAGRIVAQLWEEARTALTATQLSAGSRALEVEWQVFQLELDRRASRVERRVVSARRGITERPFLSAPADRLASEGYVIDVEGEQIWRAPDAAALLSNEFAASHCFRVDPPAKARPHWVGVGFRPAHGRESLRDIQGTLWLDRATSELRLLEFRYTSLPRNLDDPAVGGFVEFVRLPTGHWLVGRWAIRMPKLARRTIGGAGVPGGGAQERIVVDGLNVTGGELITVLRAGSPVFVTDPALLASAESSGPRPSRPSACGAGTPDGSTLSGTVRSGGRAVGGAVVAVTWPAAATTASLSTVTDDRGAWTIVCVPERVGVSLRASTATAASAPRTVQPSGGRTVTRVDLDLTALPPRPE